MQHTRFDAMPCPIARGLDRVGEWWSILILRDAFHGLTRFDQFQKSLGIAPNILSRRLRGLVEAGLLEEVRYSEQPPRDEYVLTEVGRDFRPVLWAHARPGATSISCPTDSRWRWWTPPPACWPIRCWWTRNSGKRLDQLRSAARSPADRQARRQETVMSTTVVERAPDVRVRAKRLGVKQAAMAGAALADRRRRRLVRLRLLDRRPLHREHRRCLCRRRRHGDRAEGLRLHRRGRGHRQPGGARRRSAGQARRPRLPRRAGQGRGDGRRPAGDAGESGRDAAAAGGGDRARPRPGSPPPTPRPCAPATIRSASQTLARTAAASIQSFQKADADYKQARRRRRQGAGRARCGASGNLTVIDTQKQQTAGGAGRGAIADRDTARLNLGYTELRAPIDGVVGNRSARTGAFAAVGAQLICRRAGAAACGSMRTSRKTSSRRCAPASRRRSRPTCCRT